MRFFRVAFVTAITAWHLVAGTFVAARATDKLLFLYEEYPPYTYQVDGEVKGLVVDQMRSILKDAGVEPAWRQATFSRMLRSIANGNGMPPLCIAGYGYTEERAATSWISKPFGMSAASGIAVLAGSEDKFLRHETIEEVLRDSALKGAFLQGATYGGGQMPLIEQGRARHLFIGGDDTDLGVMVLRGRVDFAMINADQVAYLNTTLAQDEKLVVLHPQGMRPAGPQHILCTKSLPLPLRERIDAAFGRLAQPTQ